MACCFPHLRYDICLPGTMNAHVDVGVSVSMLTVPNQPTRSARNEEIFTEVSGDNNDFKSRDGASVGKSTFLSTKDQVLICLRNWLYGFKHNVAEEEIDDKGDINIISDDEED
ncbi:hypothetical protein K1719_007190 [Acacia pycnantha]|nr:hypothetical protein K1719_007190 [Acacia pycnantha]